MRLKLQHILNHWSTEMFGLFRHDLNKQSTSQYNSAMPKASTENDKSAPYKANSSRLSPHEFENFLQLMQDIASGKIPSTDEQKQQALQILNDMPVIQEFIRSAHQMDCEIYNAPSYVSNIDPKLAFMTGLAGPIRLLNLGVVFIQNPSVDQNRPNFWINWSQGPINFDSRFPHILFTFGRSETDPAVSSHACSNVSINAQPPELPFIATPKSNAKPEEKKSPQESELNLSRVTPNKESFSPQKSEQKISTVVSEHQHDADFIAENKHDANSNAENEHDINATLSNAENKHKDLSSHPNQDSSLESGLSTQVSQNLDIVKLSENSREAAFEVNHPDSYQIPLEDQLASPWLPELKLQQIRDVMQGSFNMQDRYTTLQAAARFGYFLTSKFDAYLDPDLQMLKHAWINSGKPARTPNALAWDACHTAHILTTGSDIGYIERSEVLLLFSDIKEQVLRTFNSWEEFACALERQIESVVFTDDEFKQALHSTIQQMTLCKYSPWNEMINPWPVFGL